MEGRKLSLTPYPELVISPFLQQKSRKFPKVSIYSDRELTTFFILASIGFYVLGFVLSAVFGSFVSPIDIFLTAPIFSMSGYINFFGSTLSYVESKTIAGLSGHTYTISLIITSSVLLIASRKIPEPTEVSMFSTIKITRTVMVYCLAFLIDTLVMTTVAILYKYLPLGVGSISNQSSLSLVLLILFSLALNFFIYFIISDITNELLLVILSILMISLLQSFTSLSISFPILLLLTLATSLAKRGLQSSGVSNKCLLPNRNK